MTDTIDADRVRSLVAGPGERGTRTECLSWLRGRCEEAGYSWPGEPTDAPDAESHQGR